MPVESHAGSEHSNPASIETSPVRPPSPETRNDAQILGDFELADQVKIAERLKSLSSIGYHIGKDMKIKMGLTEPGSRLWYQDPVANEIKADPQELLDKDMDLLRFSMAHEGGHRRITRSEGISPELMREPGFAFLMNSVEDPRDNNFILEGYPVLAENIQHIYEHELGFGEKTKTQASETLGHTPRFVEAGNEFIKQWMRDQREEPLEIEPTLRPEVRDAVQKTIWAAQERWWTYPSKAEADTGEEVITGYAATANEILKTQIWPEIKKLVELDISDQRTAEALSEMAKEATENNVEIKDFPDLSPEQQAAVKQAIQEAIDNVKPGEDEASSDNPIIVNIDSLPDDLKQKISDHLDSLPQKVAEEKSKQAAENLASFEKDMIAEHEGMAGGHLEEVMQKAAGDQGEEPSALESTPHKNTESKPTYPESPAESIPGHKAPDADQQARLNKIRESIERLSGQESPYSEARKTVESTIDRVTSDLENVFVDRRGNKWTGGHRTGKRLDITRRMREKGRQLSAAESRAWERRKLPTEKDYAFSILVDLSGSMKGPTGAGDDGQWTRYDTSQVSSRQTKIYETFKAAIVTTEVLDRLKVPNEIVGFNSKLHEFKTFDQTLDGNIRDKMGQMLEEVNSFNAYSNDDGWAVKSVSDRLAEQKADEKYLIVLSDGEPAPSTRQRAQDFDLQTIIKGISHDTDQVLIGLGIQSQAVSEYYPTAIVENDATELTLGLAKLIEDIIQNPDKYKVR